jgi:nitronate monooxygenase
MKIATAVSGKKAWKGVWGCGQGIGVVDRITTTADLVARLRREYEAARERLCVVAATASSP